MRNYIKIIRNSILISIMMIMFLFVPNAICGTYWVDDNGAASWGSCTGASPLSGASACSMATANSNASAGDVINLRAGTYSSTYINPSNSGSSGNLITFQAYNSEAVTFTTNEGIMLVGDDYIKISDIKFYPSGSYCRFFFIGSGSDHNEIDSCTFDGSNASSFQYSVALISFYNTSFGAGSGSAYNWVHHSSFTKYGSVSCNDDGTVRVGGSSGDDSNYNLIENNVFSYGGHDCLDIGTKYNTIRNNIFHNEEAYYATPSPCSCNNCPPSGYFGNRNIIMTSYGNNTGEYNLIEGNRTGYAGIPPDDDGADGIENATPRAIIRYNYTFGNYTSGIMFKSQGDPTVGVRVYNNTIYHNGWGPVHIYGQTHTAGVQVSCYGIPIDQGVLNVVKNNIIYDNYSDAFHYSGSNCSAAFSWTNNYTSNPNFIDPILSDKTSLTLPDFSVSAGSGVIDNGAALTTTSASGSSSTTLVVNDAMYFQDGSWAPPGKINADWIAVGTVGNTVQISSINYRTNTITLASPISWSNGASVWLYKKSDGTIVLVGNAPDQGASEFSSGVGSPPPGAPGAPLPPQDVRKVS